MKILIVSQSHASYIAKVHESLRTGLAALFDVRFFGEGYDGFDPSLKTYQEILARTCSDGLPDLVIVHHNFPKSHLPYLLYEGLSDLPVKKAIVIGDYWEMFPVLNEYVQFVLSNKIDYIFSYFPQPFALWRETPLSERLVFSPVSFDPRIFRDWSLPKEFDVGFLAAGTVTPDLSFYPERHDFHQRLMKMADIKYMYAAHPGWGNFADDAPLVGKNFSRAINACKIFVTTGGKLRNIHAKIVECLASRTMLMLDDVYSPELLGLVDGVNYVRIKPEELESQMRFYLSNPDLIEAITEKGYQLALAQHSCYVRAAELRISLYDKALHERILKI
jgi:hypothetical protein